FPERSAFLDVVRQVERGAHSIDASGGGPDCDQQTAGQKLRTWAIEQVLQVTLEHLVGLGGHQVGELLEELLDGASQGEVSGERYQEEEEGKEGEEKVVGKLGSLVRDCVILPVPIEDLQEFAERHAFDARNDHPSPRLGAHLSR